MFTVRSKGGQLVVTPSSGIDRPVSRAEYRAALPFLERDAPKHEWQHVSNNTSYLEAIYEEASEERPTLESFVSARVRAAGVSSAEGTEDWESRYRDQRRRFAEAYRKLQAELVQRDAEIAKRDEAGIALAGQIQQLRRDVTDLEQQLEAAERRSVVAGILDGHDRQAREDALDAARMQDASSARTHTEAASTRKQPKHAGKAPGDARSQRRKARAQAASAKLEADGLRRQLKEAQSATASRSPTGLSVRFELGSLRVDHARPADPDDARALQAAATRLADDPDGAVTDCRRVLERCAKRLWQAENPGRSASASFRDLMGDLRDGAIPVSDWHLMKNLWSTASGIVHDGGGTPDLALWVWLGCARVAEMCAEPVAAAP